MGEEGIPTLNTEQQSSGVGESSTPIQHGDLVSTTEFTSKPKADAEPEVANKTEGAAEDAQDGKGDVDEKIETKTPETKEGEDEKTKPSGEEDRFDKHPRFQELRTRAETAEGRVSQLEKKLDDFMASQTKQTPTELPYKDVSKMSAEELLDWQSDDPQGYYANILKQAEHNLSLKFEQSLDQRTNENAIVTTYNTFAEKNPDFDAMWDKGVLETFMGKNPGHNAISAYYALTMEDRIQEAVDKAVKDAEGKFVKNQRAKRESKSLDAGPQTTGTKDAPVETELQDTKKFGGPVAVMAKRLKQRRAQAGLS